MTWYISTCFEMNAVAETVPTSYSRVYDDVLDVVSTSFIMTTGRAASSANSFVFPAVGLARVTEVSSQGEDVDDRDTRGERGTKSAGDRARERRAIIGAGAMYEFCGHARYRAETSRAENGERR